MDTIEVYQNTDCDWQVDLLSNGQPVTSYTDADTLSAQVNSGDDTASLFAPTVTWIDSAAGTLRVRIAASDTADLTPGRYRAYVNIATTEPRNILAWVGWLRVNASPGTALALSTYNTYEDMLQYFPTLDQLVTGEDRTGFQEARHEARSWLDSVILAHYRPRMVPLRHVNVCGYLSYGGAVGRDPILQGLLDDDKLVVTEQVKRICAKRAIGLVLMSCLSPTSKEFSAYQSLAQRFLSEAEGLTASYVAEVKDASDNITYRVHCGLISHRMD